jgi:ABC-2 type transport system ATP-binding protein
MSMTYTTKSDHSAAPAVVIEDLTVILGTVTAVNRLSLEVPRGRVMALLGPNGAGKTTTVSVLATLRRPSAGRVLVAGHDVAADPAAVRRVIGVTGQETSVDDRLTGRENLRLMARLAHVPRRRVRQVADEALERFSLTEAADRWVGTWSGGMRRRLDLAISLLGDPELLLLDEPTTGLDPRSRQEVWDRVRQVTARGTTVLLTTQYLEEADQLAQTVALIDHGRLVALGSAAELKQRVGRAHVEARGADGAPRSLPTTGTVGDLRRLLTSPELADDSPVTLRQPTLDDVFLTLTGQAATTTPEEVPA